jgi:putative NADH-flavin reductase
MSKSSTLVPGRHIRPPAGQGAAVVAASASQVKALIRERRKIALTFRRTRSESDRAELEQVDQELAKHDIDIPAIKKQVAQRKQTIRKPFIRRAE